MNNLKKISLIQFKNYPSASFLFQNKVTCITGANGSGKTNLLDAVYYLCYTKSYFSAYQQNSVQTGTDGFRVSGVFTNTVGKEETISCKWKAGKKEVFNGAQEYEKLTDHIGKYAAVIIAPDDTELINGGGELRRKWLDSILCQVDKTYFESLIHYQRILMQRNAWLKLNGALPAPPIAELDFYNSALANCGGYIYNARNAFLQTFLPILDIFYVRLSGGNEQIKVQYNSGLAVKPLAELLYDSLQTDLRLQRTMKGTHRDDLEFILNDLSLKQFGSQGQKKSFLFALKLAQYQFLYQALGHMPLLLLDDIFEKLDQARMEALLKIICGKGFGQVILTDTHPERVSLAFGAGADIGFICL